MVWPLSLIAGTLLVYRLVVLTIPFFRAELFTRPFANVLVGLANDVMIFSLLAAFLLPFAAGRSRWPARVVMVLALVLMVAFATHVRYVEHFGLDLRPFHVGALKGGEVWSVGVSMVLESERAWAVLVLPLLLLVALRGRIMRLAEWLKPRRRRLVATLVSLIVVAPLANTIHLNLRTRPGVHNGLRYNPFVAIYRNYDELKNGKMMAFPPPEARKELRRLVGGVRHWSGLEEFPLWQERIPDLPPATEEAGRIRQELRQWLIEEAKRHGPWNVVIVTVEGLRAYDLAAFDTEAFRGPGLGPGILELAREGIRFTETIASGHRTHFGQTAIQCSLYGAEDFTILGSAPTSHSVCLGDIFKAKGYRTHFYYAADNNFDNQALFYRFHGTDVVEDENDFVDAVVRGGWGYSDKELYRHVLRRLEQSAQPFFVNVLTLTNHSPWTLPEDASDAVKSSKLDLHEKLVQYVDETLTEFVRELTRRYPRTIVVVVGDHGRFDGIKVGGSVPNYGALRAATRVAWLITAAGMPESVRGTALGHLTSQTDVAPTLLTLLGWTDVPQQFMGMDAFARKVPVLNDWMNVLLEVDPDFNVKPVEQHLEDLLGAVPRYNLLAPPRDSWKMDERPSLSAGFGP